MQFGEGDLEYGRYEEMEREGGNVEQMNKEYRMTKDRLERVFRSQSFF